MRISRFSLRSVSTALWLGVQHAKSVGTIAVCLGLFSASTAFTTTAEAQQTTKEVTAAGKPRLAIRAIEATEGVKAEAERQGQWATLRQILDGADGQLLNAIEQTRKFQVVARKDLQEVVKEQDLGESGNIDANDAQRARALAMKGAGYVLVVTVDNYQDLATRAVLEGQLGQAAMERRVVQLQAVVKIYDATGTSLIRSTSQTIETKPYVTEVLAGQQQDGRQSNKVIGEVSKLLAQRAANDFVDFIFPAKATGLTNGVMTFNRTKDSGVEVGQWWRVLAPGEEMFDPDNGESLGSEEVPVGWAKVIEAGDRSSKAQMYEDTGADCDSILRFVGGEPEGAGSFARSSATCRREGRTAAPSGARGGVPQGTPVPPVSGVSSRTPSNTANDAAPPLPGSNEVPQTTTQSASTAKPLRLAFFVQDREAGADAARVGAIEDAFRAAITGPEIELIAREDAVNAVARLTKDRPNQGTSGGSAKAFDLEQQLSESTSAVNLAANLDADALVVATITSLTERNIEFDDPSLKVKTKTTQRNLTVTYRIVDGATGGALASANVVKSDNRRQTENLQSDPVPVADLLRAAAEELAQKARSTVLMGRMRAPTPPAADVLVQVRPVLADLSIPDIQMIDGKPTVTSGAYKLEPMQMDVFVDGLLVGTAPGAFEIRPGIHNIRVERAGFEPYSAMMKTRAGMTIAPPMRLTNTEIARVQELASFFQGLKERAVLSDAQLEMAKAFAQFLRNSNIRLDTSNVQNLEVGNSYWREFFP
jgi:curli biogenesis system outer membrane secretion channel CsgG